MADGPRSCACGGQSQLQEELALAKHELALSEKLRLALQSQLRDSPKGAVGGHRVVPRLD